MRAYRSHYLESGFISCNTQIQYLKDVIYKIRERGLDRKERIEEEFELYRNGANKEAEQVARFNRRYWDPGNREEIISVRLILNECIGVW